MSATLVRNTECRLNIDHGLSLYCCYARHARFRLEHTTVGHPDKVFMAGLPKTRKVAANPVKKAD